MRLTARIARQSVAVFLSGLLAFQPVLVQAQQITPDGNAPVANQPGVGSAPNGVPLIDIAAPNSQGLSHNKYHDFNVGSPGAILNNLNAEIGTSQLGGVTPGNPNLRSSGPASVILNEVTSSNRSLLEGAIEVFGNRADVIVANPNGISCSGCGLINTPRATLTTGTPDIDPSGRLGGFTVQGGDVTFGSKGGNFAAGNGSVDLFDIVSRRVQVDGPVSAKNLRLSVGRQKFDYATGETTALGGADDAPEFAIDGSALGAMQADRIRIVVTDKGAGVRMRGDMAANAGELTLSADGRISLGNVSGRDGISIQSKSEKAEAKKVASKKKVIVKADKGITLQSVAADDDVILNAGTGLLSVAGDTATLGTIELTSSGAIAAGNVSAGKNASLQAGEGIAAGTVIADGAVSLQTTSGNINLSGTAKAGGGDLTLSAASGSIAGTSLISFNNMTLTAGQDITLGDAILSGGALVASSSTLRATSAASGVDFAQTQASGAATASGGSIRLGSSGDMRLTAAGGAIGIGTILSAGQLDASGSAIQTGNITAYGAVNLAGTTTVTGQLLSGSDITITGPSINLGTAFAGVDVLALKEGHVIPGSQGDLRLAAPSGSVMADRLVSAGDMAVTGEAVTANLLAYGNLNVNAGGALTLTGQSLAGGSATLNADAITIDTLVSGVDFAETARSGGLLILRAAGAGAGSMTIAASGGSIIADRLISGGDLKAKARQNITYNSLQSFAAADLNALSGTISLDHETVAKGDLTLALQNLDLSHDRGRLATAGTLIVNAASADLSHSTLTFGGIALNLTGTLDASGTKLSAVITDGGSGDIAIAATTINTTAATALLAAHDLTLTLASLVNAGQFAANNDLTFTIAGSFANTPTGLVYAGHDGRLFVAGDLLNDQGAILVGNDLTIAADASGNRNASLTNISGLIQAGRDVSITTANLTNKRLSVPTWSDVVVSDDEIAKFILNPDTWGKPLGALFVDPRTGLPLDAYGEDVERATTGEWMSQLYGVLTFADGTSYRTRPFIYSDDNTPWDYVGNHKSVGSMLAALKNFYPTDVDGNIILTPELQSKLILIVNNDDTYAEGHVWDDNTQMRQTIHEQQFDGPLSPEALIRSGRNLAIDATTLTNSYSSIEADGDARLTGSVLTNEGVALYRTVTSTCEATGGCEAYDADGNRDGVNDLDYGNSRVTGQTIVAGAYGNIKAAGNLDISSFATVNNTSAPGSIAGGAALSAAPNTDDPTSGLDGLTAGGALYTPNAALGSSLTGADLVAALGHSAPKPNSGGFGGTIPGQVFLYETRAAFLDVGRFYGSGYFINRIGYNPDRAIPFLGDAWFENQLIDRQLRDLINQGLGKGSFIPGSDAIEQMKTLLDRGADFAKEHGLIIGEKLSPELIASLTETLVWYETKIVNGIEVLVPTVYIADTDRANLTVAGSIISGGSLTMNVGDVNNSGLISAKTDLRLDATNITATGGSFIAGNDLSLKTSQNLTITAADMQIGGETFVKPGSGVVAGGNADLAAGNDLTLTGAEITAGNDVSLTGQTVTLGTAKATNNGSDNVIGTTIQSGGDTTITATDTVNIIGSDVAAGGNLGIEAEQGSVNIVAAEVNKKVNGGGNHMSQTDRTFAQGSNLTSGGDTSIKADDDILIAGSNVKADGDLSLQAKDDITIAAAQETSTYALDSQSDGLFKSSESHVRTDTITSVGSSISGGAGVNISSGDNTIISASKVQAGTEDQKADLNIDAGGDLIIASGKDTSETDMSKSGSGFLSKSSGKSHTYDETTVASDLSASGNVNLNADRNVVIAGSNVTAGVNIAVEGDSVSIIGAQEQHDLETSSKKSGLGAGSGDGFYSVWGKEKKSHSESATVNVGSTLSAGGDVSITARETDVNIIGSHVAAGNDIVLEAERDVNILPGAESYLSEDKESRSGIGIQVKTGNGSASIGIGYGSAKDEFRQGAETNAVSSLSAGRDVIITAGRDANLQAAQVEAGSTVDILAERDVNLLSAQDKTNYEYMHQELFVGVTAAVTSQAAAAVGNAYDAASRVGDGNTANSIAMATIAGINGKFVYDIVNGINANNPNPGGQLISGSLGIGFQYEKNSGEGSSSFPVPTTISAGDTVIIEAGRDINAEGAQISAGYDEYGLPTGGRGDIALIAGNDINLESAIATTENSSKNVSAGASIKIGRAHV